MEAGFIALLALTLIIGVAVGLLIGKKIAERRYINETQYTQGTLDVDCSDSEFGPSLFLGLAVPVKDVIKRKYITFDVNVLFKNSHE